jgi:cytochrome c oxidase accessory protein FixG
MREQVCKYMCPYARFQSVMFDKDTLVITYDYDRGEPRGSRSKALNPRDKGLGDCVDCNICVQVCPVGIDIRQGLQYECIGCAACIDGCDQVMARFGYPPGLIRYSTENALSNRLDTSTVWRRVLRPRTLLYSAVLLTIVAATAGSLAMRNPLKVDVIRDRGALAREATPGIIENVYRLQLMNTDETPRRFAIDATGVPGVHVVGVDQPVAIGAAQTRLLPLRLQAPAEGASPGTYKIEFTVRDLDDERVARHEKSSFVFPR